MIKTETIFNELKKSVIGQDEYLKQLALTGYKHQLKNKLIEMGKEPICSNLLVVGPSGCGKTFSVKLLSKLLDVPFFEINCSNLVQVGYKGASDLEKSLGDMVSQFKSKYKNAIIYLDEFDKLLDLALIKDGKGKSTQQNFLKFLEPNNVNVLVTGLGGRSDTKMEIDTSGLTFIATGSFELIKEERKKKNCTKMGFKESASEVDNTLNEEDIINGGFMPELIGRFSQLVNINQLTKEDFYNIIKNGQNSVLKTYEALIESQEIGLDIEDDVFKVIAERSYSTATGARNIAKTLNNVLDNCLSDISNDASICKVFVKCIDGEIKIEYEHDPERKRRFEGYENGTLLKIEDITKVASEFIDDFGLVEKDSHELIRKIEEELFIHGENGDITKANLRSLLGKKKQEINKECTKDSAGIDDLPEIKRCEFMLYDHLLLIHSEDSNNNKEGH